MLILLTSAPDSTTTKPIVLAEPTKKQVVKRCVVSPVPNSNAPRRAAFLQIRRDISHSSPYSSLALPLAEGTRL